MEGKKSKEATEIYKNDEGRVRDTSGRTRPLKQRRPLK